MFSVLVPFFFLACCVTILVDGAVGSVCTFVGTCVRYILASIFKCVRNKNWVHRDGASYILLARHVRTFENHLDKRFAPIEISVSRRRPDSFTREKGGVARKLRAISSCGKRRRNSMDTQRSTDTHKFNQKTGTYSRTLEPRSQPVPSRR
jgi:hypothetical protein